MPAIASQRWHTNPKEALLIAVFNQSPVTVNASETALYAAVAASPILRPILDRWDLIGLPDCWLAGGAIAQTVWNTLYAFAPDHGLADVDLIYFDAADRSECGEALQSARVGALFADLPMKIDLTNEARVHLWYEAKFGYSIEPYRSSEHAIATFPTTAGAVAVRPNGTGFAIFAPFELSDLLNGVVRPNRVQITKAIYEAKANRWRCCWPKLEIIEWSADVGISTV